MSDRKPAVDKDKNNTEKASTAQSLKQTVLPHNLTMEQSILAALLTVAESFEQVNDLISESDFYATRHQYIYRAIASLSNSQQPYDAVLVNDWLISHNLSEASGGEKYLMDIFADSPSSFYNIESYALKIKEAATLRNMIAVGQDIVKNCSTTQGRPVTEILDQAETALFNVAEQHHNNAKKNTPHNISSVLTSVFDKLNELSQSDSPITGLTTGFVELDNKTSGMQNGDLIIVAARPSMGKTTFAMNLVESVLFQNNLPALVFSMEMPADSIAMRLISSYGGVHQGHLRSGKMDGDEWGKVTGTIVQLQEKHLYIDDSSALPPTELRSRARRIAKLHGGKLGCIMVDYLQLMKVHGLGDNRVAEISEISRSLKALAKELNCPVIALSQLNRSLENRPNKRPVMSDLRESGAIEQDADLIMFIYRDEVYNKESKEAGTAEIIIGKQRNGPIGSVRLAFEGAYTRFRNLSPEYYSQMQDEE